MGSIIKCSPEEKKVIKRKLLLSLTFGVLFLSLAIVLLIIDPIFILSKYYTRIDYGTAFYEFLNQEVDSVHISAYLFNITNADRFISGEDKRLVVEEIGPFTYQENRTNEGFVLDQAAGVMRYTPQHHVTFIPEESVGNPEDMVVTMPNMAMLAMGSMVDNYGYLGKTMFNILSRQLSSKPTVTMTAHDYLWGYNEPLIQLGNRFLPGWINFDKLGVLDRLYDKKARTLLEVGSTDKDKFLIKTVNGIPGLPVLGYDDPETRSSCNTFTDSYEGISFPPGMNSSMPIKIYRNVLCRLLPLEYVGKDLMDFGVEGFMYRVSNLTYQDIPENDCVCAKPVCIEGVSDLSACFYGLPMTLSNAHFLNASPTLYEKVEGLNPNVKDHGSRFIIEPYLGMMMATKFSVQLNINVGDVGFNSLISPFSNTMVPVVNLRMLQPKLPDASIAFIRTTVIYGPYIRIAMQLSCLIAGLLLLLNATRVLYRNWFTSRRKFLSIKLENVNAKEVMCNEPFVKR